MKYDFTTVYDRRGMDALAVDALGQPGGFAPGKPKDGFSVIPMWVADMNFATVPTIPAAIIERAQHPLYGYFATPDAYYQAITDWQRDRNGVTDLPKEAIGYENGVLGGVMSALGCLAAPAMPCWSTAPPTSALPARWNPTATASSTAPCTGTKTACGEWILTTWTAC